MNIDEVELWRSAFSYALENHPVIDWPSTDFSHTIHDAMIQTFVEGARYATNNPKEPDPQG